MKPPAQAVTGSAVAPAGFDGANVVDGARLPPGTTDLETVSVCELCGLTAHKPILAEIQGVRHVFCCGGCRQVYHLLVESGQFTEGADFTQSPIYKHALLMGLIARPDQPEPPSVPLESQTSMALVDSNSASSELDATRNAAFLVGGMWCSSCAWLIEHTVGRARGVTACRAYFASDVVRVTYKPARTSEEDLSAIIRKLGYTAEKYSDAGGAADSPAARARKNDFLRAVIALIFAMNVNMFSLALYVGYAQKLGPTWSKVLPEWVLLLSLPVMWAGIPVYVRAWEGLKRGAATMETLVTLGSLSAFVFSFWEMAHHGIRVYFDTADMLIALVLMGKHTESGARGDATSAISLLYGLLPRKALVRGEGGREQLVAVDKLGIGDQVQVKPGERIPADGRIVEGSAAIDESLVSGESRPVRKSVGDEVTGATLSTDAPLVVEVTRVGEESTLSKMIGLVEDAMAVKSPTERWADRIARLFVPSIIALAVGTGVVLWLGHAEPGAILIRVVSILVVACPCALALATPLAITTAVGAAASRGILIVNPAVMEVLPRVNRVMFDKTGTLTEGRFAVRDFNGDNGDLAAIAAVESLSEHPLAHALVAYAGQIGLRVAPGAVSGFERLEGSGVTGDIDGVRWFAGNRSMAAACGAAIPDALDRRAGERETAGMTVLFYGASAQVRGVIVLGDALRPGAIHAVERLKGLQISSELISGDAVSTTVAVASDAGITRSTGGMSPVDKVDRVREVQAETTGKRPVVAMVGDGINDAPALAQADVGIAFGSGTEIARRSADITLVTEDLSRLGDLFTLAGRTAQIIRQNLFWACIYNGVCIPLAVMGYVNPIFAAVAMLVSSMSVVFNTKRLKWELGVR